jgi:molecular chaperone DnaK (HSP70)
VIERNTPVPIEQTRTFTTFQDDQESVKIRVYQGESRQSEDDELLGQFEFSGFKKGRRGEVQIDVTFEINADGIVNVTARDQGTGQEASTRITLSSGLSEAEVDGIIEEARTDRVQPTTVPNGEVLGALQLETRPAQNIPQAREALEPEPAQPLDAAEEDLRAYGNAPDDEIDLLPDEDLPPLPPGDTGVRDDIELDATDESAIELLEEADVVSDDLAATRPTELFEAPGIDLSEGSDDGEGRA